MAIEGSTDPIWHVRAPWGKEGKGKWSLQDLGEAPKPLYFPSVFSPGYIHAHCILFACLFASLLFPPMLPILMMKMGTHAHTQLDKLK